MNRDRLIIMWLVGLGVSWIFFQTGITLLAHSAANPGTSAAGHPVAHLVGTIWPYVIPIVIIGTLLMISFKGRR